MKKASFQFSPALYVFLAPAWRKNGFEYTFNGPQSVKHLVEAAGVPHTEVSNLRINGASASFDTQVQDGDQVEVFSFLSDLVNSSLRASGLHERSNPPQLPDDLSLRASTLSERSNPPQLPDDLSLRASAMSERSNLQLVNEPHYILDNHLGKLTSYLRMLGFDCLYRNDFQDDELAQRSQEQSRILLTRDHRLLMRKTVTKGYWLRSQDPDKQLREVVRRYSLTGLIKPFQRCMRCNNLLESVSKEDILHKLLPLTIQFFDDFRLCTSCGQVYWQGSHYTKMLAFIEQITQDHPSPDGRGFGDEGI
jgi:uncharacterized protein